MKFLIMTLLVFLLSTWAYAEESALHWQPSELIGYSYKLVDNSIVEDYSFAKGGYVSSTAGKKDGPVIGVAMYWRISKKGSLIISAQPGKDGDSLIKVGIYGDEVIVDSSGVRKVFKKIKK